jgi:hypothetical protein
MTRWCTAAARSRPGCVRDAIAARLAQVGLELHPDKTRIVYCKDADRRGSYEPTKFTFLGYEFRPRLAKNKHGKNFVSFLPAVSTEAIKEMGREIRSWHMAKRSDKSLNDLARMFNSVVQGWIKILRTLLQVPVALLPPAAQQPPGAVGLPEVQTTATQPRTPCDGMAGRDRQTIPPAVCALAVGRTS